MPQGETFSAGTQHPQAAAVGGSKPNDKTPGAQPMGDDRETPGDQERPMNEDEALDEALAETFPTSDPISPSRIDGPNN